MTDETIQIIARIIGSIAMVFSLYIALRSFFDKGKTPYGKSIKVGLWVLGLFFTLLGAFFLLMVIIGTFVGADLDFGGFIFLFILGILPLIAGVLLILVATGRWKHK